MGKEENFSFILYLYIGVKYKEKNQVLSVFRKYVEKVQIQTVFKEKYAEIVLVDLDLEFEVKNVD